MNVIEKIIQENLTIESENLLIYPCYLDKNTLLDLYEIYSDEKNVIGYAKVFNDHIEFIHFIRDEIAFDSLDNLKKAIQADEKYALNYLSRDE